MKKLGTTRFVFFVFVVKKSDFLSNEFHVHASLGNGRACRPKVHTFSHSRRIYIPVQLVPPPPHPQDLPNHLNLKSKPHTQGSMRSNTCTIFIDIWRRVFVEEVFSQGGLLLYSPFTGKAKNFLQTNSPQEKLPSNELSSIIEKLSLDWFLKFPITRINICR